MVVTIADLRRIVDEADTTTGWTGAGFGVQTSDFAESTGAVAEALNIATGDVYYTQSPSTDVSDECVYVYSSNSALQLGWETWPNALLLGDGTNLIAFAMAGADRRVFNHLDGPTSWQCLVLDGAKAGAMDTAGLTTAISGTFASLNLAAITIMGVHFITGSKALGGGFNVSVDIIRSGNDGIRLTGGGVATETVFAEIAVADRSTASAAAHGVFRELTAGVYGCQSTLVFGDPNTATDCRVLDDGIVIAFEGRDIADDKYRIIILGHTTATNSFVLTNTTISTGGPQVAFTCSGGNVDTLTLTSVVFSNLGAAVTFSTNADASGHAVTFCTFTGSGVINTGAIDFDDNIIDATPQITYQGGTFLRNTVSAYTGVANTSALVWNETPNPTGLLDGCSFTANSGILSHAIEFGLASATTINLNNVTFTGYSGTNNVSDSTLYIKRTTGTVTINISGGTTPSYRTDGATVSIINAKTVSVTVRSQTDNSLVTGARVYMAAATGGPLPFEASVTITQSQTTATVSHIGHTYIPGDKILIRGASPDPYNQIQTITTTTDGLSYNYEMLSKPGVDATGTITSTAVILDAATSGTGIIEETGFNFVSDQPISGRVRRSTTSPLYKTGKLTGTITSAGLQLTTLLVSDE